ncbi:MAG: hypothetical protein IIB45_07810 [Candidatus Marinimicrobia bacterium]|nr:hypothetical protein [Candidatus Neomarinimicrobiota bacterium]
MSTDLTSITKKYFYKNNKFEELISIVTEAEIDCMVYELYGLTEEESVLVEENI